MNLLSADYIDQVLIELSRLSNEWSSRRQKVTTYELELTEETLSIKHEPVDKIDFKEFESSNSDDALDLRNYAMQ